MIKRKKVTLQKAKLFQGDCLEIMKSIPSKSIDMILCDLPYGTTTCKWDTIIPFEPLWDQYNRVIKDNGAIILFAQSLFYVDLVNSNRKMFRYDLVWNKVLTSGFLNAKRMPLREHEQIAVFYKKLPTYNPQFTEGKPLHGMGKASQTKNNNYGYVDSRKNPSRARTGDTQKYPKSILTFSRPSSATMLHPTQKPVALLEHLIKTYTNDNEIVLDNCMGSGSTGIACLNTKRKFIRIELEEKYFNIAENRIKKREKEIEEKERC